MRAIGVPGIEKRHESGAFFARMAGSYRLALKKRGVTEEGGQVPRI